MSIISNFAVNDNLNGYVKSNISDVVENPIIISVQKNPKTLNVLGKGKPKNCTEHDQNNYEQKIFTLESLSKHLKDGNLITPSVISAGKKYYNDDGTPLMVPSKSGRLRHKQDSPTYHYSSLIVLDIDCPNDSQSEIPHTGTEFYSNIAFAYPTPSYKKGVNNKHRVVFQLSRQILDEEKIEYCDRNGDKFTAPFYQSLVEFVGGTFPEYENDKKLIVKYDACSEKFWQFYFGCTNPDSLFENLNADSINVDDIAERIKTDSLVGLFSPSKGIKIGTPTKDKKTTSDVVGGDSNGIDDGDSNGIDDGDSNGIDGEDITQKILKYIYETIFVDVCERDINRFYCRYDHNLQICDRNEVDKIINYEGRNFGSSIDSTSMWIYQQEKGLPPIYNQRSTGKGCNYIEYWYQAGVFLGDYPKNKSLKGDFFKSIVTDICEHFDVLCYPFTKKEKQLHKINEMIGHRLSYDELNMQILYKNKPIDWATYHLDLITIGCHIEKISREESREIVIKLAKRNSFHPIRNYLKSLPRTDDLSILDNLSTRFLGTSNPLYDDFLKKTLIGAVARVMEPGCKMQTVLVMKGLQGLKKSAFFEALLPNKKWFDDTLLMQKVLHDKDELSKISKAWILELAELETVFSVKETSSFRSFITTKTDRFRVPYGTVVEDFERCSIFIGTVNADTFLSDPEGNRRYWVIPLPLKSEIDTRQLAKNKDLIWGAALQAWNLYKKDEEKGEDLDRSDYKWWYTLDENKKVDENNENHTKENYFEDELLPSLEHLEYVNIYEIMINKLGITNPSEKPKTIEGLTKALKKAGWINQGQKKINGKRATYWKNPDANYKPKSDSDSDSDF